MDAGPGSSCSRPRELNIFIAANVADCNMNPIIQLTIEH